MKKVHFTAVACAAAMLLVASRGSAQDEKCRDAVYNGSRKVHQQEAKGNRKDCIKDQTGDKTACIAADRAKSTDQAGKLTAKYADKCASLPAFGVNASVADIINAAQDASDNYHYNKWGATVDPNGTKCNDKASKRAGDLSTAQWKAFRKCVKDAEPVGSIAAIEGCIASGIAAGTAGKGGKLSDDLAACAAGTDNDNLDGDCDPHGPTSCFIDNVECETCLALNTVTGGAADCSAISGISCGVPVHKCTFDEATDSSEFNLYLQANADFTGLVTAISGAVDITCDPATQDGNGKRECTCALQAWTPPQITGVGFVCLDAVGSCPTGEMDCDGGNALGVDMFDDAEIGACTSHADCSSQCDTYCGGIGKAQWRSGCEEFCQGGSRDGLACICDQVGSSGCVGGTPGVDDCPGGSCVGKNNEADQDCQCQCVDFAAGGAGDPGDMQCNLAAQIKVVASLPCTSAALVTLPPICTPLTTQVASGESTNSNEAGSFIGPHSNPGAPETCANFDTSVTTGMTLVSNIGFFDSTIGDLRSILTFDCQ